MKKMQSPKKFVVIEMLKCMPYDYHGMHATGRRIYAPAAFPTPGLYGWDEYEDADGELHYANR